MFPLLSLPNVRQNCHVENVVIYSIKKFDFGVVFAYRELRCEIWICEGNVGSFQFPRSWTNFRHVLSESFDFIQEQFEQGKTFKAAHYFAPFNVWEKDDSCELVRVFFAINSVIKLKKIKFYRVFTLKDFETLAVGIFRLSSNPKLNKGWFRTKDLIKQKGLTAVIKDELQSIFVILAKNVELLVLKKLTKIINMSRIFMIEALKFAIKWKCLENNQRLQTK